MTPLTSDVKLIEKVKSQIVNIEAPTEHILAALKGAEYVLLLRLAAEKGEIVE